MLSERVCTSRMWSPTRLNPCFSGTCSRSHLENLSKYYQRVLILVLVEHALGGDLDNISVVYHTVLILVLVEHALGVAFEDYLHLEPLVLILVLVEHALGDLAQLLRRQSLTS